MKPSVFAVYSIIFDCITQQIVLYNTIFYCLSLNIILLEVRPLGDYVQYTSSKVKGAGGTGQRGQLPRCLVVRGQRGAAKCCFQKNDFPEILNHINIQMESSCFSSAVTIIEQLLLLSKSQNV